jgi:hypothetical protein
MTDKIKIKGIDIEKLDHALENEKNENMFHLSLDKIMEMNVKIINELKLPKKDALVLCKKLNECMFIDELSDIREGAYIKWIPIKDDSLSDIKLKEGAFICGYEIGEKGVYIKCKNFRHGYFSLYLENNLIFQKLSNQELIILTAMKYI